jgi:hypothetical protein
MQMSKVVAAGSVHLLQGQTVMLHLQRGTVLRVASGSIALVQHVSLEQSLLPLQSTIARGGVHCVYAAGWATVQALEDVEFLAFSAEPVSALQMLRNGLVACWRWAVAQRNSARVQWG